MGYTIEAKNSHAQIIEKHIESNDKKDNNKMKTNSYENIKSIVSEQNSLQRINKNDAKNNNTIKNKINIGL